MLRNMEYVYEVYKQGSFTKAAKSLYVSQPCLSALVKKTEEKLGFPIFNRNSNPLQLTECRNITVTSSRCARWKMNLITISTTCAD